MLVSIVVPIYNTGRTLLTRCIDSLLAQTYLDLEIILVDDGSTDDSSMVCREYADKDGRVRLIQKKNGGEASARNAGLEQAAGVYVGFCDSDDELFPDAVHLLAEGFQKGSAVDLTVGAYLERSGPVTRIAVANRERYQMNEAVAESILDPSQYGSRYIFSTVCGKLFRRDVIQKYGISFDEQMNVGNDTIFMRDYMAVCHTGFNVFVPVYCYYKYQCEDRTQGTSWLYPDWFLFLKQVWEKEDALLRSSGCPEETMNQIFQQMSGQLIGSLVMATAYEDRFPYPLEEAVQKILDSPLVAEAMARYHPVRLCDSVQIPELIRKKKLENLMEALRVSAGEYIGRKGRQENARLLYKLTAQ